MHDPDFRQAEKDWFSFVDKLTERLVEIDDSVPELPVKDIVSCSPRRAHGKGTAQGTTLSAGHLIKFTDTKWHRSSAFIATSASPKTQHPTRYRFTH